MVSSRCNLETQVILSTGQRARPRSKRPSRQENRAPTGGSNRLLATVNTKAEYLEYQRRIILTEALLDAVDEHSDISLPKKERAKISTFADSMILNAFRCSRCPFIVSRDFDVGYTVMADDRLKDAIMPDRLAREYRNYHFV